MIKIKLKNKEYQYLAKSEFLQEKLKSIILSSVQSGENYLLEIDEEQADDIRDVCGERLQLVGFDENYEPTEEGILLESLIDKFFSG